MAQDNNQFPLAAGYYARTSTGRQENDQTIDSQEAEIKERIISDGNQLAADSSFVDDGWTGSILERPALDQALEAAKMGKFKILYVYDLGRLARKYHYQKMISEEFEESGVQVISLHDRKIESEEDKIMQGIEGIFHEYERLKIFRRFQRGKLFKAKQGVIINGQALYGFTRISKTKDTPATYLINENETRVVRMIFDWFVKESVPMRQIIKLLHDQGIPTRKNKQEWWTKGPIIRVLKCETYINGQAYFNKSQAVPTKHPRIERKYKRLKNGSRIVRPREEWIPFNVPKILDRPGDQELFEKAQKMLIFNKKYANKKTSHNYLLTGLVFCECGLRRTGDGCSRHGHHYYRCVERIKTPSIDYKCKSPGSNSDVLDKEVWERLDKFFKNPANLREYAHNWIKAQRNNEISDSEKKRILGEIAKIEQEEERYQKAYGAGIVRFEQLENLTRDAEKRRTTFTKRLSEVAEQPKRSMPKPEHINLIARELKESLMSLDYSSQKTIIRDTIDRVIIFGHKKVQVWGHLPINTERLDYHAEDRYRRSTQRRKINIV